MQQRLTTVYVVEDEPNLRDDFCRAVSQTAGLQLVGSTGSAREAQRLLQSGPMLDVLLVDLGLPDGDGLDVIRTLRQHLPQAKALVLSVFQDDSHVLTALSAGAQGYLLKDATDAELLHAITDVAHGDAPLSPQVARHLLRAFEGRLAEPATSSPAIEPVVKERLTPREAEILTLVSLGHSGQQVAGRLGLSHHTVYTHLRNCHSKLEARNRQQAIHRARASGQIG
jgi:DNA-binding NarL/FixJ family response regulator